MEKGRKQKTLSDGLKYHRNIHFIQNPVPGFSGSPSYTFLSSTLRLDWAQTIQNCDLIKKEL